MSHWWLFVVAALVLGSSAGCRDALLYDLSWGWPGRDKEDPAELARYGVMPLQKMQEIEVLAAKANSGTAEEREQVTQELARRIQKEMDPIVRTKIMTALGSTQTPTALAVLRAGVRDPDASVRLACCVAWGKQGGRESIELLEGVIRSDKEVDVRLAAIAALGKLKDPSCVQALSPALEDSDIAVQFRAMESMKQISGRDYGHDVQKWREYAQGGQPAEPTMTAMDRIRSFF
jgi:HEAT repeat protein